MFLSPHDLIALLGFRLHFEILLVFVDAQIRRFLISNWVVEQIFASTFILFCFGVFKGRTPRYSIFIIRLGRHVLIISLLSRQLDSFGLWGVVFKL